MKKILQSLIFLLIFATSNQLKAQNVDFTVRYNASSGNYEVYALPDFSDPIYFVGGGSQISLVLPANIADVPLSITTVNGGLWTDNSQVYAPLADTVHDFHGIASNGSIISLVAGQEILMYTFTLPGGACEGGIRLYVNGSDPNSAQPGMGGGDFENYFANAFTFVDSYNTNYNNTGTSCNAPVVTPNPITIMRDSTGLICSSIADPDSGDTFTATSCGTNNGTEMISVNGGEVCVTYTPNVGYVGTDSVCLIVCDQFGACDTTFVPISIIEPIPPSTIPKPPVVVPTPITTLEDSTIMVCTPVLDPNIGDIFTANLCIGSPENGAATPTIVNDQLCIQYTPNAGFSGDDEICIIVCDQTGRCDTVSIPARVIPTIEPPTIPQPPIIIFPPIVGPEDSIITTCGPIVDPNPEDTHNIIICGQPTNGIVSATIDNSINSLCLVFTPDDNFTGIDSTCIIVCDQTGRCDTLYIPIVILPSNDSPIAVNDTSTTSINTLVMGNLLINDKDPDGDNLIVNATPIAPPVGGSVTINSTGTYTFIPTSGFTGEGGFAYEICDDGTPQMCDTATVSISIVDVLFPPFILPNPITSPQDSVTEICMTITDPNQGDTFTATICGAENGTPTAMVNNAQVCVEYIPDAGFSGTDSVCLIICDQAGLCDTLILPVTIVAPLPPSNTPEPPVVITTPLTIPEDSMGIVCTPIVDSNAGDTFTATLCSGSPTNGTATTTINGNQLCVEYTPNPDFTGDEGICVIVCDQTGLCDTIEILVTVVPEIQSPMIPQPPVVIMPPIVNPSDSIAIICGPIADANPGDTHTATICEQPTNGTATLSINNVSGQLCIAFIPDAGFVGDDSLCVIVCDQAGLCDTVNIPITIISSITKLELKVLLQGALLFTNDGLMRDDLRTMGVIPLNQPYSANLSPRFTHVGGGSETTTPLLLSQNAFTPDAIVDWVFIEIRNPSNSATVIRTIAALVQRDGDVIDAQTGSSLYVVGLPSSFYVSIKHRNHLGAMTAAPIAVVGGKVVLDFTTMEDGDLHHKVSINYNYDGLEQTTMTGKRALWAGNANADSKIKYDGTTNDRINLANDVLTFSGNSTSLNLNYDNAIGYFQGDIDMNGKAKYDGALNDRIIIQNIVLTFPLNSLVLNNFNDLLEQLP